MKNTAFILFIFFSSVSFSQDLQKRYYTINSYEYNRSVDSIDNYIFSKNFTVISKKIQEKKTNNIGRNIKNRKKKGYLLKTIEYNFLVSNENVNEVDILIKKLGDLQIFEIIESKSDNNYKIDKLKSDVEYFKKEKEKHEKYKYSLSNKESELYLKIWERINKIDEDIYLNEQKIKDLEKSFEFEKEIKIFLVINDVSDIPQTYNTNEKNINHSSMSGLQYSFLNIYNPRENITNNNYHGVSFKYLFNTSSISNNSKNYIFFQYYRSANRRESYFNDLLLIGLGQNFYTRFYNPNNVSFFNLYGGYSFGLQYFFREDSSVSTFFVTPNLGMEIIKTDYIILGAETSYLVPFYRTNNTNGFIISASLNFVF